MFSHIMLGANEMEESRRFYDALLQTLGVAPGSADKKGRIFWVMPRGFFSITKPLDGRPACGANGGTISFSATSPEQIEEWHAVGLASGGTDCEDPPGWRGGQAPDHMYAAYLRDPTGNKLCALYIPGDTNIAKILNL